MTVRSLQQVPDGVASAHPAREQVSVVRLKVDLRSSWSPRLLLAVALLENLKTVGFRRCGLVSGFSPPVAMLTVAAAFACLRSEYAGPGGLGSLTNNGDPGATLCSKLVARQASR